MVEESDSSIENTALREAEEEIDLKKEDVDVLCTLPPSLMGFREIIKCSTVVCTLRNNDVRLQASSEVDRMFWVPLRTFLGEGEEGDGGSSHWQVTHKYRRKFFVPVDYFKIPNHPDFIVWGFTARLCIIIASIVYSTPPSFPFGHYYVTSAISDNIEISEFRLPGVHRD